MAELQNYPRTAPYIAIDLLHPDQSRLETWEFGAGARIRQVFGWPDIWLYVGYSMIGPNTAFGAFNQKASYSQLGTNTAFGYLGEAKAKGSMGSEFKGAPS